MGRLQWPRANWRGPAEPPDLWAARGPWSQFLCARVLLSSTCVQSQQVASCAEPVGGPEVRARTCGSGARVNLDFVPLSWVRRPHCGRLFGARFQYVHLFQVQPEAKTRTRIAAAAPAPATTTWVLEYSRTRVCPAAGGHLVAKFKSLNRRRQSGSKYVISLRACSWAGALAPSWPPIGQLLRVAAAFACPFWSVGVNFGLAPAARQGAACFYSYLPAPHPGDR